MHKQKKYFFLLVLLMFNCAPTRERVVFQITNNCSTGIVSRYVLLKNDDTISINFLAPYQTYIISDSYLPGNQKTNWFFDYAYHINYITSYNTGDTLKFNPNESGHWQLNHAASYENFYTLALVDSSF